MNFHLITLFPELVNEALKWGVIGRAHEKNIFQFNTINPRDFTNDVHKTVDDRPFGGGDGMVLLYEPLQKALTSIPEWHNKKRIYLSPTGRLLTETVVKELSQSQDFILLSGRYGGVDQRFLHNYEFEQVSIGDYVVSGGELPALILMDALLRKVPGVLGNTESSQSDSFAKNPHFEAPLFTRPREADYGAVPSALLSGDHKKIDDFRRWVGLGLTLQWRPELVTLSPEDSQKLKKFLQSAPLAELKLMGFSEEFLKKWN